jgi:hypothetical protein
MATHEQLHAIVEKPRFLGLQPRWFHWKILKIKFMVANFLDQGENSLTKNFIRL